VIFHIGKPSLIPINDRYTTISTKKATGATYTPQNLSDFVAKKIVQFMRPTFKSGTRLQILDPAVGEGQLLLSLLSNITSHSQSMIDVFGFETNEDALLVATNRIKQQFPMTNLNLQVGNFLDYVTNQYDIQDDVGFSQVPHLDPFDLVIANPPYVRTQILGARQAQMLSRKFNLRGRVDLYYAFILGIGEILKPGGIAGIIVSNRFMMTKSGASVRRRILERFNIHHIWDMGDTKLFEVAVLPAVLLLERKSESETDNSWKEATRFTSIYTTHEIEQATSDDPISALMTSGVVLTKDGRRFLITNGTLDTGSTLGSPWRITTPEVDTWLQTVAQNTFTKFGAIGKVRVGVKTTADKVFIRSDWEEMTDTTRPELLQPIITHHIARRFKASSSDKQKQILYPYIFLYGKRTLIDLEKFPRTKAYLEQHYDILSARKYLREAGRQWCEIWVPQDPQAWPKPKLVFRDIVEKPTFWIDLEGRIVNGDCYWLTLKTGNNNDDLLWLALAIGNSKFIEIFYDHKFHNKLYAGRRRFITQYVEEFPLPRPDTALGRHIIDLTKEIYNLIPSQETNMMEEELDCLVWQAFGLNIKEFLG